VRQIFVGSHPSGPPANRKDQGEVETVKKTRAEANGTIRDTRTMRIFREPIEGGGAGESLFVDF